MAKRSEFYEAKNKTFNCSEANQVTSHTFLPSFLTIAVTTRIEGYLNQGFATYLEWTQMITDLQHGHSGRAA